MNNIKISINHPNKERDIKQENTKEIKDAIKEIQEILINQGIKLKFLIK